MPTQPNPLVVLSMHRSGSSVLTGCLHLLGVYLGSNLMPANQANEMGYWENENVTMINEILLRELDCAWDMVGALPKNWLELPAAQKAKRHLRKILDSEFSPDILWGIKDPRLCHLFPLWDEVFRERGEQPGVIVIVRHPMEVANSLFRRDKIDLHKGLLLWLHANRSAFAICRDRPHVLVTYDQILADPITVLANIERRLTITYPKPLREVYRDILDFVRTDLKHATQRADEQNEPLSDAGFTSLYEYIRCLATGMDAGRTLAASPAKHQDASERETLTLPPIMGDLFTPLQGAEGRLTAEERLRKAAPQLFDRLLEHIGFQERLWKSHQVERERRILTSMDNGTSLHCQLFFPQEKSPVYVKECSKSLLLSPGGWQELIFPVDNPLPLRQYGLRFDPLNTKGMINISEIRLVNVTNGDIVFRGDSPEAFAQLSIREDAFAIDGQQTLTLCSFGNDPQVYLPPLDVPDCPLELHIWIQVQAKQESLKNFWEQRAQALVDARERIQCLTSAEVAQKQALAAVQTQLQEAQAKGLAQVETLTETVTAKERALAAVQTQLQEAQAKGLAQVETLTETVTAKERALAAVQTQLQEAQAEGLAQVETLTETVTTKERALAAVQAQLQEAQAKGLAQVETLTETVTTKERALAAVQTQLQEAQAKGLAQVETLTETVAAKERALAAVQAQLQEAQAKGLAQNEMAANVTRLELLLSSKNQELSIAQKHAKTLEQALISRIQELAEVSETLHQRQRDLQTRNERITELEAALSTTRDQEISSKTHVQIRDELDTVQQQMNILNMAFIESQDTVERQKAEIEALHAARKESQRTAAEQNKEIEQVQAQLEEKGQLLAQYQEALNQADQEVEEQYAAFEDSMKNQQELLGQREQQLANSQEELHAAQDTLRRIKQSLGLQEGQNRRQALSQFATHSTIGPRHAPWRSEKSQLRTNANQIINSGLFDADWYANRYGHLLPAGKNPAEHYLSQGAGLGFDPCPLFSTVYYLQNNLDVALAGQNPLLHYLQKQNAKNHDPHPLFSTSWYRHSYAEARQTKQTPLAHYLTEGVKLGLQPHPLFDPAWYKAKYMSEDDQNLFPLLHFVVYGLERGYDPGPLFNGVWYKAAYPVASDYSMPPLLYYLRYGHQEGHCPGPNFNPGWYLEQYPDVAQAGQDPLVHYLRHGCKEGRRGIPA